MRACDFFCTVVSCNEISGCIFARASYFPVIVDCMLDSTFLLLIANHPTHDTTFW